MDLCAEVDAQLTKGLGGAKVNVQLMYVVIYRRRINTGDDIFKGLCDNRFIGTWLPLRLGIKVDPIRALGHFVSAYGLGPANLLILVFPQAHKLHVPPEV